MGGADAHRLEERRLIERVLAGDERAFTTMYREHTGRLFRLALRLCGGADADAEDLVQETWHRAIRALDRFEGRSSLGTWLSSIVTRSAMERYRADQRNGRLEQREPASGSGRDTSGRLDLERAFAQLPVGFRTVLVLHDLEGYRHADIASLLGVSEGTSKSQLSRARARMRELLGEDYATS